MKLDSIGEECSIYNYLVFTFHCSHWPLYTGLYY